MTGHHNTIHLDHPAPALTRRIALAAPALGEWGAVGRARDLEDLHTALTREKRVTLALTGLGGLGKTTLAAVYTEAYGRQYGLVAWIQAESPDLIPAQFQNLLRNVTGQEVPETATTAALKALLGERDDWLLVFDNASSPGEIHGYVPASDGRVLITTRNETWWHAHRRVVRVSPLSPADVRGWLREALPSEPETSHARLAERLGGLPLAVTQAIAYITSRPGETIDGYLERMADKEGQRVLLARKPPPGYPAPVATTWNIALSGLRTGQPEAAELLALLAYVSPDDVPFAMLRDLEGVDDLAGALDSLQSLGMVRCSADSVGVHRLVQDISRWAADEDEEKRRLDVWGTHLTALAPDHEDHGEFAWYTAAAPHVLRLCGHASRLRHATGDLADLAHRTGISLNDQAAHRLAATLFEQSLELRYALPGDVRLPAGRTLGQLGVAHRGAGRLREATEVLEESLAVLREAVGETHPDVARTLNNLGRTHTRAGRCEEAIACHLGARDRYRELHGPDHREVASSYVNLGVARLANREPADALRDLEEARAIFTRALGPRHPQTAWALGNTGLALLAAGRHADALRTYRRALEIFEEAYGPAHRDVALTLGGMGRAYAGLGRFDEATALQEKGVATLETIYGPRHDVVVRARVELDETRRARRGESGEDG
ncbi:tetratricopeptide (TPR) repeat protein [Streptomyces sp. T12]|uniref:tetratricopeptide repeat protein n=1 Tax=Streptomyces sp. T12 TaxID=477697 RepID=UPI00119DAF57|nr:tetratricopeptide repeat protein [Streptomyces sp. T12]TWD10753.1 tetratricopeptide (TPR) repeat protein [Streptomyces sp. T12]